MKTITLFGASDASKQEWNDAEEIGRRIGKKGYTLKNGGYNGVMAASAKGCIETGGKVIGVCVAGHFGNVVTPNTYSTEIILARDLDDRIAHLLNTDAAIVVPGGLGTMEELMRAWSRKTVGHNFPLYLFGEKNMRLLEMLRSQKFVQEEYFKYVKPAKSIDDLDILY